MRRKHSCAAVLVAIVLILAVLYVLSDRFAQPKGRVLVETGVSYAVWSKDGKALYYVTDGGDIARYTLCRYDVRTGRKEYYKVPAFQSFDISPDAKAIVYTTQDEILIHDLRSGRTSRVFPSPATSNRQFAPSWVYWSSKRILFQASSGEIWAVYTLDLQTKRMSLIPGTAGNPMEGQASDGSGIVYYGNAVDHHVFYDLVDEKRIVLDTPEINKARGAGTFVFISRDLIVYIRRGGASAEALDLLAMKSHHVVLKDYSYRSMAISPDLSKYWVGQLSSGDLFSQPAHLYLVDIPKQTTNMLLRNHAKH